MACAFLFGAGCETHSHVTVTPPAVPAVLSPSLKIAADSHGQLTGTGATRFQLNQVRNLQFRLQLPAAPLGVTWVTMQLFTPSGALYHTRHTPYSTDPTIKQVASPDGVPHPIDVVQAEPVPGGGMGLDTEVIVAGTNLNRYPLPGDWKVVLEVDGQPQSRAEAKFELAVVQ